MEKPPAHYFANPDTRRRLRFWFGGKLRDELWLDASSPESAELSEMVGAYHVRLAETAEAAGVVWLVEVYDPEAEHYERYGTDAERLATVPPARPHNSGPLTRLDGP